MDLRAASDQRLLGPGPYSITEPTWDWSRDWMKIAARALEFVANDPFAAAMVQCKIDNTHGPDGLLPISLAQLDVTKPVSKQDHAVRETLERGWTAANGLGFDAGGQLTRKAFDRQLDWLATVMGEAFAIRIWKPGRKRTPFATCWRLIRPERVSNPDGRPNSSKLYHGLEMDDDGEVIALWVETTRVGDFAVWSKRTWMRVEWYAEDGTANVVHRFGWRIPGQLRGISMFTPMLLLARQLGGTIEAHVTAKRAQACNPVIYYVENPEKAAEKARLDGNSVVGPHTKFNPLQVYYAKLGNTVQFNNTNFAGDDLEKFLDVGFRVLSATWQQPVEVVLCSMGKAALASARAGLDQIARTSKGWQGDHIEQASDPFEQGTTAEQVALGNVTPGPSGLAGLSLSKYRRPPNYSTDRKKDADTMKILREVGVSGTSSFSQFGYDYEEEVDQSIRDEKYEHEARAAAGLPPSDADLLKKVQGSIAAIAAGLSNWETEIAKYSDKPWAKVWEQLLIERKKAQEMGLVLDLSGTNAPAPDSTVGDDDEEEEDDTDDGQNPPGEKSSSTDEDKKTKPASVVAP